MDYRKLRLERNEIIRYALEAGALTGLVGFCYYNSLAALLFYPLVLLFYLRYKTKTRIRQRREELKLQFKDAVQAIAAALRAGYSAENAVAEAGRDLTRVYSERADMVQELAAMQRKMEGGQTIESVMENFGERSGIEEAETFAEIFAVGKRNGGDLIGIMNDTARTIAQTVETERSVAASLGSRRYEQRIMNAIPFAMLLYLRVGSRGFLDPLYGNLAGVLIMTFCLAVYVGAWMLGKKLLEIEV